MHFLVRFKGLNNSITVTSIAETSALQFSWKSGMFPSCHRKDLEVQPFGCKPGSLRQKASAQTSAFESRYERQFIL